MWERLVNGVYLFGCHELLFELQSDQVHLKAGQSACKEPAILPNKDAIGRLILTKHEES